MIKSLLAFRGDYLLGAVKMREHSSRLWMTFVAPACALIATLAATVSCGPKLPRTSIGPIVGIEARRAEELNKGYENQGALVVGQMYKMTVELGYRLWAVRVKSRVSAAELLDIKIVLFPDQGSPAPCVSFHDDGHGTIDFLFVLPEKSVPKAFQISDDAPVSVETLVGRR